MPKKRGTYSEETIQKALLEIRSKAISKHQASKIYNIPRSTLIFRLGEQFQKVAPGPPTILSTSEENALAEWLIICQKKGFPKRKEDVLDAVKDFIEEDKRVTPFKNNMPGRGWFKSFLNRNPNVALRVPDPVTAASSRVSATDIERWFNSISNYLKESNNFDILESPNRIYNGDETNFLLCPKTRSVLAAKGARNIYEIERGPGKSNLTVMCTFSANGNTVPPMVIYPYKRVPEEIRKSVPQSWALAISENGWMTKQVFYEYISKHFHPYLVANKITFPVIYFVDGHSTHMTLKVSELCVRLGIIIIALYPNATRILQPCDYAAFKPLKNCWAKMVGQWRKENPGSSFTREHFAPVLSKAFDNCITPQIIENGFKACGLFPWDFSAIDCSKCLGKSSIEIAPNTVPPNSNIVIDYEEFSKICGHSKIQCFEDILKHPHNLEQFDEHFKLLFRMFITFKGITISELLTLQPQHSDSNECQNAETFNNSVNDENQIIAEFDINEISEFVYYDDHNVSNPLGSLTSQNTFVERSFEKEVVVTIEEELKITSENNTITSNSSDQTKPKQLQTTDEFCQPSVKSIENYLDWPVTPMKVGSQPSKPKKPFVITSPIWIELEKEKKNLKDKLILEKEKRQTERFEKTRIKKEESALKSLMAKQKRLDKKIKSKSKSKTRPTKMIPSENTNGTQNIRYADSFEPRSSEKIDTENLMPALDTDIHQQICDKVVTKNNQNEAYLDGPANENDEVDRNEGSTSVVSLIEIGNNKGAKGSMCYSCTYSFSRTHTSENVGIKCSRCIREYHTLNALIILNGK